MKVTITRGVMIKGEPTEVGSTVDLEANDAFLLITSNKAVAAPEGEVEAKVTPEPEPEPEAPAPVKRTRQFRSPKE
jgi:hypothetical protein